MLQFYTLFHKKAKAAHAILSITFKTRSQQNSQTYFLRRALKAVYCFFLPDINYEKDEKDSFFDGIDKYLIYCS
jgi:hypothetical protein